MKDALVYVSRPRNAPVPLSVLTITLLVLTLCVGMQFPTLRVADFNQQNPDQRSPLTTHYSPLTSSRLAVIQPAPDFTLTTQPGDKLSSADLKGKVLLVSFI